jgi:SM-20-related protein
MSQEGTAAGGRPAVNATPGTVLNLDVIRSAPLSADPYPWLMGQNFLSADTIDDLRRGFPAIDRPGFLTVDEVGLKGTFRRLVDELEGPALTEALSQRFGLDLHRFPRLTTIRRLSQARDGRIHTGGPSKVVTLFLYMNDGWPGSGEGRLRVLRGPENFDDMVAEVTPTMGTVFAFRRGETSWHGHMPFSGERRVVQVSWVRSAEDLARKRKRNALSQILKRIFGR